MSAPWWTVPGAASRLTPADGAGALQPQLAEPSSRAHIRELARRAASFVPEWNRGGNDAGDALVLLFGAQIQPLIDRINRLPEKQLVEFLRVAGIQQLPGGVAGALLAFEATDGAPAAAFVAGGFQVGAKPADGSQGLVVFETRRDVNVVPGAIAQAAVQVGRSSIAIEDPTAGDKPFLAFGDRAVAGRALLIGIESPIAPGPTISLGFMVAPVAGAPPPVSQGGVQPPAGRLLPILEWEVLDRTSFVPAALISDETAGLTTSGVVELRPPRWRPGLPAGVDGPDTLYWMRVRIVHGFYPDPPLLSRVVMNAVRADAAETIRNEILEHVPGTDNRMRLSRTPVLPSSLVLEIQEGVSTGDLLDGDDEPDEEDPATGVRRWREVPDLSVFGPNARVFTLDRLLGEVTFGDGVHGAPLPPGFRHVQAVKYRVGGGSRGAVDADQIKTLVNSAPFLRGVANPEAAGGGTDLEPPAAAIKRGPQEIRARGRAVTERDYELMARQAPGAAVARAHAVSGLHPVLQGARIPGVVGVFVLHAGRVQGPPVADAETLRAVARHLAGTVAPAGVEVVAAAPRFHRIRAEVRVQIADPGANPGETVRQVIDALNAYFDPIQGGDDDEGWPFGGAIRYVALLRRLLSRVPAVAAIPRLNLVLDGTRFPLCADVPISTVGLLFPDTHQVTIESAGGAS